MHADFPRDARQRCADGVVVWLIFTINIRYNGTGMYFLRRPIFILRAERGHIV